MVSGNAGVAGYTTGYTFPVAGSRRAIGCLVDQSAQRQPRHVSNIVIGEAMAEFQHRRRSNEKCESRVTQLLILIRGIKMPR